MLGEGNFITPLPTKDPAPNTFTGHASQAAKALNDVDGTDSAIEALANEIGVGYNVAKQFAEDFLRNINWMHSR